MERSSRLRIHGVTLLCDHRAMHPSSLAGCLSPDLEVGRRDRRIHSLAAVRTDTGRRVVPGTGGKLSVAPAQPDDLAGGAAFVPGHSRIAFDLPHPAAEKPGLRLPELPVVDALRLGPLAFPRSPRHHLGACAAESSAGSSPHFRGDTRPESRPWIHTHGYLHHGSEVLWDHVPPIPSGKVLWRRLLVEHCEDGGLERGRSNDPELDACLRRQALQGVTPDLPAAWHWPSTPEPADKDRALDDLFTEGAGGRASQAIEPGRARG